MTFQWTYIPWPQQLGDDSAAPLAADDLLQVKANPRWAFTAHGAVFYADLSYLACRLLMLASFKLHPEALYHAGQVLEKYMKAILQQQVDHSGGTFRPERLGHRLKKIARRVGKSHGEFNDPQFLEVCGRLEPFEVAGRYPDHELLSWNYGLNLLTFLDGFVRHCRDVLDQDLCHLVGHSASEDPIREVIFVDRSSNAVQLAASIAVCERNREIAEISTYSPATIVRLRREAWDRLAVEAAKNRTDSGLH